MKSTQERFEEKFMPEPMSGCWLWTGARRKNGYGAFRMGRSVDAHVASYKIFRGDPPKGLDLDHTCRNPSCVNPAHLKPVTHAENMARGAHATKTHCKHGHEFTTENTYRRGKTRHCRLCVDRRRAKWKAGRI